MVYVCLNKEFESYVKSENGVLLYTDMISLGLGRYDIKKLEKDGTIEKVERGIYCHKEYTADTMKIYQKMNSKMIYSNETALYLHDLVDRYPMVYTATTISGYHLRKKENLKLYYVKEELWDIGKMEIKDPWGNILNVYDMERTICDIVKNQKKIELQVYLQAIKNYFQRKDKNLRKLARYAKKMGIQDKIRDIVYMHMEP